MLVTRWEFFEKDRKDELLNSWNDLLQQTKIATAAGSYPFFKHANLLLNPKKFLLALGFNKNHLITIIPLMVTNKNTYGFDYNSLELVYHDHLECFVLPNQDKLDLVKLIKSLKSACISQIPSWDIFVARRWLFNFDSDVPYMSSTYQRQAAYLNINKSENYQHIIPKKLLKNITRFEKRLSTQGEVKLQVSTDSGHVVAAVEDFIVLEKSGWKGKKGSAIGCNTNLKQFYVNCWTEFAKMGNAKIFTLTLAGKSIASALAFEHSPYLFLHKIAYDESLSNNGPGSILIKQIIEYEFNNNSNSTICFNTNPPWVSRWRPEFYSINAIIFTNRNIKGLVLNLFNIITTKLKLLKRKLAKNE